MVYGSAFSKHGFIVLEDGKLYGFGYNGYYQLGTGDAENKFKLTKIPLEKSIKKICCGNFHSLFQLKDGSVRSCGGNSEAQLCLGDRKTRRLPTVILFNEDIEIEEIFVGKSHSVFLTKSMEVYSGGDNNNGQIGLGNEKNRSKWPTKIVLKEKIISVSCGSEFTFFISINGNIFATGDNTFGELGFKSDINVWKILTPVLIPFFKDKKIIQIACGCDHSIFFCADNKMYASGWNIYVSTGREFSTNVFAPKNDGIGKKTIPIDSKELLLCE